MVVRKIVVMGNIKDRYLRKQSAVDIYFIFVSRSIECFNSEILIYLDI